MTTRRTQVERPGPRAGLIDHRSGNPIEGRCLCKLVPLLLTRPESR